ncbi:MAG: RHS repeat-associated core domain-containing protein [Clostridia bacterium]|nr:RHS repeat-associated core domain-containing protein [Clostridia bacterium]
MTKTVNDVATTYYYQGSLLIAEETNSQILVYIYGTNGSPVGFKYRGADYESGVWDAYAYEKNIQGDIVAVYDASTGTKLISYRYNAWGVCSPTYHNSGSTTTATKNPFKYRGYYYDSDLGLYYLQSRYYDQNTGRFISPDSLMSGVNGSLHGFNLYAYCFNNPISFIDSEGNWPTKEEVYKWIENKRDEAEEVWNDVTEWVENKVSEIGAGSAGVSLSFTYDHVLVNVQVGIAKDRQGNKDLQISISSGSTSAAYGLFIGGYSTITNAPSVDKLTGGYSQVGGSYGSLAYGLPVAGGVDVIKMNDADTNDIYHGLSFSGGFGTPGVEAHFGTGTTFSYTGVVDTYNQVINFFDDLR